MAFGIIRKMKDYNQTYQAIRRPFQKRPHLLTFLVWLNGHITQLMYLIYPGLLLYLAWSGIRTGMDFLHQLLPFILIPGISFVGLSLLRKLFKQTRPYEDWEITPLVPKVSTGNSMPSRHVFSATMISMCVLQVQPLLGCGLLLLSLILAYCRVLVGVHYPKDVVVGFLIGLAAGLLLFLF